MTTKRFQKHFRPAPDVQEWLNKIPVGCQAMVINHALRTFAQSHEGREIAERSVRPALGFELVKES